MQGEDIKSKQHNCHGLTPEDIIGSLNTITEPYAILIDDIGRYYVITESLTHVGDPMYFVIEIGAGLVINSKENINKIVTMFAMREKSIKKKIESNTVLYLKI